MELDEEEGQAVLRFIREKFGEYYGENAGEIKPPASLEKREFGFIPLKKEKTMIRHKGFTEVEQLRIFIKTLTPSDVYYSSAYYMNPSEERMRDKGWLGADLVFDIDCDHIQTPCKSEHDTWVCVNCGGTGVGKEPERCPKCDTEKFEVDSWICERCLEKAKQETLKLISMLEEDFGMLEDSASVVFSGHRGYHVHVEEGTVKSLGAEERKEIVDYVTATGLNIELHFLPKLKEKVFNLASAGYGWRGRIAKAVYSMLLKKPEDLRMMGLREVTVKNIVEKREQLLEEFHAGSEASPKRWKGKGMLDEVFRKAVSSEMVAVDTVVTTDVHRLIRLPSTLHGKTGFKVVQMAVDELNEFDPLKDAVAFTRGSVQVKILEAKPMRVGENVYGPYSGEKVELPTAPALFFLCRGKAALG